MGVGFSSRSSLICSFTAITNNNEVALNCMKERREKKQSIYTNCLAFLMRRCSEGKTKTVMAVVRRTLEETWIAEGSSVTVVVSWVIHDGMAETTVV